MQYLKHLGRLAALRRRILKFFYPLWSVFASKKKVDAINAESIRAAQAGNGELTILVHGILTNYYSGVYWAVRWFRRAGIHVVSLGYDYRTDLRTSAIELGAQADAIARLPGITRVSMVGISLGGQVARYYIEKLGGKNMVMRLVTVFSPLTAPRPHEVSIARFMDEISGHKELTKQSLEQTVSIEESFSVEHLALYGTRDMVVGMHAFPRIPVPTHVVMLPVAGGHTFVSYNSDAMEYALKFIIYGPDVVRAHAEANLSSTPTGSHSTSRPATLHGHGS